MKPTRQFRFSVWLILQLNRLAPDLNGEIVQAKRELSRYSGFEYSRAPSTAAAYGAAWLDVRDKRVLDIGCGLGGFERYYLERGAREVIAIDLSRPHLLGAQGYVRAAIGQPPILFGEVDARRMAFGDNTFDVIVSSNTLEHIFGVEAALREMARIIKPEGVICLNFPPYRSPWGAHLNNWIKFPWCQVLFSEEALVAAANHIEDRVRLNAWMPEAIQLNLRGLQQIPHLNRLSLREFDQMLNRVPLKVVQVEYKTLGWRAHRHIGRLTSLLARSVVLRELITSQAIYILKKAAP